MYTEQMYLLLATGRPIFTDVDEAREIDGLPAEPAGRTGRGANEGLSSSPEGAAWARTGRAKDAAPVCSREGPRWLSYRYGASVRERSGGPCLIGELRGLNALVRQARQVCLAVGPGWL